MRLLIILTLTSNFCFAQRRSIPDELFGFRLGQYKNVVTNELGQPATTKLLADSAIVDFYYVSNDSSIYLAFQYQAEKPNEIYAIQLSGHGMDRTFYGLNLGDNDLKLNLIFGRPDTVLAQQFNDKYAETWKYNRLNFSVLFVDKKIKSFRIWDGYHKKNYDPPTIEELLEIIKTNDRSKIADILSPALEVFYCDNVLTWKNSFYKDIYLEKSSVFDFITNTEFGLASLIGNRKLKAEYNLRFVPGLGSFPVYKFPKETLISELVLNFQQGKYKIWEMKYRCDN